MGDFLLEKYLHFFTTEEQTTSPIREQLNKITEELKVKTREISRPFSFISGSVAGIESSLYLDSEIVLDIIEKLTTKFEAGREIEVVAPQLLKSRTVGLCGNMNGEKSADLKTPRMCVMSPHLAALSFILNNSGSAPGFERCTGIPAALKPEFLRLSTECPREVIIPTPISKLYEAISVLTRPTGMMRIVEKKSKQLCISKQMVKICLSKPLSIKQKSVEFACVPQPSVLARSLEKRALSGEVLFQEISQLPTVFRKVEFEPVACKSDMSSMTL